MLLMRFAIDAVFIDRSSRVVRVAHRASGPGCRSCRRAARMP
jgi:hypothetical protein